MQASAGGGSASGIGHRLVSCCGNGDQYIFASLFPSVGCGEADSEIQKGVRRGWGYLHDISPSGQYPAMKLQGKRISNLTGCLNLGPNVQ